MHTLLRYSWCPMHAGVWAFARSQGLQYAHNPIQPNEEHELTPELVVELDSFFNYADGQLLLALDGRALGIHHSDGSLTPNNPAPSAGTSRKSGSGGKGAADADAAAGVQLCGVARCDGSEVVGGNMCVLPACLPACMVVCGSMHA